MATIEKRELREVVVSSKTICDKCGNEIKEDAYKVFDCRFEYKTGEAYPPGAYGNLSELDLCRKCGKEAMELLQKNGFNIQRSEWDY